MSATTTEGTGPGSAADIKPKIYNGVVKNVNIARNALNMYEGLLSVDGTSENDPVAYINGGLEVENDVDFNSNLHVSGGVNIDNNLSVDGYVVSNSYVRGYAAGQLLNTSFYTFSDGVLTNASGTYTDFANVSYTPVRATSKLLIEYHATFAVNGANGDGFRSRITVDASEITWRSQTWADSAGGGTRSGVLFPISMVYTNSNTTAKTIKISANRASGDDTLSVDTTSAYLRISEYAR
jgi:hypothetical protein